MKWLRPFSIALMLLSIMALAALGIAYTTREDVAKMSAPVAAEKPADGKIRVIAFGAHPDDCELKAGGAAALWAAQGHKVKFVSTTNGDIGHWREAGGPLAIRRRNEVEQCAKIIGNEVEVLDIHDGELMPTLENRAIFTRLIRNWKADVVLAPRPWDYHPDHRYTGVLVQDAAFMVICPFFCAETPYLRNNPVFMYCSDGFQKPYPFKPDVVVAIDDVIEKKCEGLLCLDSQLIEGCVSGNESMVPHNEEESVKRHDQVREGLKRRFASTANDYRDKLIALYGEEQGKKVKYAEAFEICEYGSRPSPERLKELFPFIK
jgi:LmbE family N-acetylglucosaminyl deacetylase